MAEPIEYVPSAFPTQRTAEEELQQLVQTLHESGALRVARGLVGRFGRVSEVIAGRLDTPEGRNVVGNVVAAATATAQLDAGHTADLVMGLVRGLEAAHEGAKGRPPGAVRLGELLLREDTRRGLYAALLFLERLGAHLRSPRGDTSALVPGER